MRILINYFSVILIILILTLIIKSTALAHIPLDTSVSATKAEPIFVEDHQISWAAYNQLDKTGDVDYYRFQAEQGEEIYFNMVIPQIERYQDFRPDVALIGPV